MVDPITAYTVATTAIAGIRKAIQLGRDVRECQAEFSDFFSAKDAIAEKAKQAKKTKSKNVNQEALEAALNLKKLREDEAELRTALSWSGQGQVWADMQKIRVQLIREKKEQEAREKAELEKKKTILTYVVVLGSVFSFCGYTIYKFFLWLINYHK